MEQKPKSLVKTMLKHPSTMLAALLGKPMHIDIPENQVTYTEAPQTAATNTVPPSPPAPDADDPLYRDWQKAEGVLKGITSKLVEKLPSSESLPKPQIHVQTNTLRKFLPYGIFAIVGVLLIILVFSVLIPLIRNMGGPEVEPTFVQTESPTPVEYIPSIPSVYATDPEIVKLDEDISVLDLEIAGTQLRETTLNPPSLDFNISF